MRFTLIISKINNVSFGKFYIKDDDYTSAQEQYLCNISSKLKHKCGEYNSYTEKIEKLGYDICADSGYSQDKIRVYLTKADKSEKNPTRRIIMATLGEFTTNFNPELGVTTANSCTKTDKIIKRFLLAFAATLALIAGGKACSIKAAKASAATVTESSKSPIKSVIANNIRTLHLK